MKFINDWSSNAKQTDKLALEVRIGSFRLTILNFTITN
jgi:hypothetical protein